MNTIFVPKIINVGYQNRVGTYTGKLAYIIYTDEKGTIRKKASWDSWRDNDIEPDTFDNTPISGFVLNKKVGDTCSHWNFRQAYCRVYDPRGFEFEITIENLLYILENTNSIVGKGLEGEFVYGWSGKDLILLPTNSPDYKEIMSYTNAICSKNKITAKSLIVGATYLGKDGFNYIYLGKHTEYDYPTKFYKENQREDGKQFWFWKINPEKNPYPFVIDTGGYDVDKICFKNIHYEGDIGDYITRKSISNTFLIDIISSEPSIHMNAIMDVMNHNSLFSPVDITRKVILHENEFDFINRIQRIYKERTEKGYSMAARYCYITFFTQAEDGRIQNYVIGTDFNSRIFRIYPALPDEIWYNSVWITPLMSETAEEIGEELTYGKLREIYHKYHPCCCDIYLKNGVHYRRMYVEGE